jgi:hypothetical protein
MKSQSGAVLERPITRGTCKHHWLIEPANGPSSRAACKLCGEVKVFDNVLADLLSSSDRYSPFALGALKAEDEDEEDDTEASEV